MQIPCKRPDFSIALFKTKPDELTISCRELILDYIEHLEAVITNHDCEMNIKKNKET